MLSLQKRLRFIICQLHLSKVCFCLKKRETESYWFGMFGSFLNPNKPTYLLWKQKWEYLVSSGSDGGPSTCSLPWRATSSPPSSQELSPCLVSGLFNLTWVLSSRTKGRGVHQDGASLGPFACVPPSKEAKLSLWYHAWLSVHSFWPPKKMQTQTQRPPLRRVGTWMTW